MQPCDPPREPGLRCGIEIHQQLETGHRLFCSCPPRLSDEHPALTIVRRLRAVAGEMGVVDPAALHELSVGRSFEYKVFGGENCLVETDCEPPHGLDAEALGTALEAALMLKCFIPAETAVMRKTVIDGSNPSGFQRTLVLGLDGAMETADGPVRIANVCLEEESAQILDRRPDATVYGLDRLGIPLVEIGTEADISTPEQAREAAERIGMVLRSTGKVKRGIGTIRQDINVSIPGGSRVEIKGAQELRLIPKLVGNEAERQAALLRVRDELSASGFKRPQPSFREVTRLFRNTESRIMQGKDVHAMVVPGFAGFLKRKLTGTRTLGNEIAAFARVRAGIPGIIHSDEDLQKYGLEAEFAEVGRALGAREGDTVIIAAADGETARKTFGALAERIGQLLGGVPGEVRKALPSGDTEFLRPLPGAARMYPETDVPPVMLTAPMLAAARKSLPETWDRKIARLAKQYGIPAELSGQLVRSGMDFMFERLAKRHEPKLVAATLASTFREIGREGVNTEAITEEGLEGLFGLVAGKKLAREALPGALRAMAEAPGRSADEALSHAGIKAVSREELALIIRGIIAERKELLSHPRRENVIMGLVMEKVRGKIDGRTVMELLRKELEKAG